MTALLEIRAGRTALAHIRRQGLTPADIRVVTGASGAAKWLSIYGLYRTIFSQWLQDVSQPVFLYGTSIGAWTLAAGAQADPARAYDQLKAAYIAQVYRGNITPEKISEVSFQILDRVFGPDRVAEILNHPSIQLGFSAVRCKGPMAMESLSAQTGGMFAGFGLNLFSKRTQRLFFKRTLFHTGTASVRVPVRFSGPGTDKVVLDRTNFRQALLASGSIPVVMSGIRDIPASPPGMYRDGGILDYHPVVSLKKEAPGFILYPHFYPWIIPGWFDKTLPWRRARGKVLDRTILVSPSDAFVRKLPFKRIPDRKDFIRFQGRDPQRFRTWDAAAQLSLELGSEFLDLIKTGQICERVKEF